jgi:valyl-tRNA synthetase
MICYAGEGVPPEVQKDPNTWIQDEDVLDTWFSAGLWPFASLGWPENTLELQRFYPNSVLITGHDILFFWVARMIMMGECAMGDAPFPDVYLHGLIYGKSYWRNSADGRIVYVTEKERLDYDLGHPLPVDVLFRWEKMSKSKGNIIDPIELIEEYGTDAMRMALSASATQAREIDLDRRRFEEFRNFANKMWNGARFVLINLEGDPDHGTTPLTAEEFSAGLDESLLALEDHWILSSLNRTVNDVNGKLAGYQFDQAAVEAYDFFWKQFCAYYVEIAKPVLFGKAGSPHERKNKQKLLVIVLNQAIRLIHPMAPFITEELFQLLKQRLEGITINKGIDPYTAECIRSLQFPACIVSPYPHIIRESDVNPEIEEAFALIERVVYLIRNVRGEMKLPPGQATEVHIVGDANDPSFTRVQKNQSIIPALVRTQSIQFHNEEPKIALASSGMVESLKVLIPLPTQLVDQEKTRLIKERERIVANLERTHKQLNNPEFVLNAPAALIEKHKQQVKQLETELSSLQTKLDALSGTTT